LSETPPAAPAPATPPAPDQRQAWDAPPNKVGALQVVAMIAVVGFTWLAAAIIGSIIAFQGMVQELPKLGNSMMVDIVAFAVDDYLTYMYYRDAPSAAQLFSSDSGIDEADLQALLEDQYYLFDGFLDIEVTETEGMPDYFNNPEQASMEGQVMTLHGTIEYEDGTVGTFSAEMLYEDEQWRLNAIDITVPQEKIDAYTGED
jgi:hypothetical protein